jgi:hypothetical protein
MYKMPFSKSLFEEKRSYDKPEFVGMIERCSEGSALRLPLKGHCPLRIPFLLRISPFMGLVRSSSGVSRG